MVLGIVIGENVFRQREMGAGPLPAAVEGAVEVGKPVIFSVLTTVVAFWPLLLGIGTIEKIMRDLFCIYTLLLIPCGYLIPEDLHAVFGRLKFKKEVKRDRRAKQP